MTWSDRKSRGELLSTAEGHIPSNYVVTPRSSHNRLDFSMRCPHDVSSAPMAILTEGETWDRPPKHHGQTVPLPSIAKMHPPTFSSGSCWIPGSWMWRGRPTPLLSPFPP